jgi:beta-lactamase class A
MTEYRDNKKQKHHKLESSFGRISLTPPELSIVDILSCICDEKALLILKVIALSENNDTDILITKLRLRRKQYYSSMEKLVNAGLVKRINGKYRLTSFGKVIFSTQAKVETEIETALKHYWELKAFDSITMKMSARDKELFLQQRQKIIDDLIDNHEIKDILLSEEGLNSQSNAAAKAGFIADRRCLLTKVINNLSEQEIVDLAEHVAKTTNKDSILFIKKEYAIKSALDLLETWIKISGYPYRHKQTNNNGQSRHLYVIQHDMGIKWSVYLANLYQFLFDELGEHKRRIEFDKTENTLAFTIDSE